MQTFEREGAHVRNCKLVVHSNSLVSNGSF
jgi:hypothetical protein